MQIKLITEFNLSNSSCSLTKLGDYGSEPEQEKSYIAPKITHQLHIYWPSDWVKVGYKLLIINIYVNQKRLRGPSNFAGAVTGVNCERVKCRLPIAFLVTVFSTLPFTFIIIISL